MRKRIVSLFLIMLICVGGFACNVRFLINDKEDFDENAIYQVGEEIKVTVFIDFVHTPCPLAIENSKIKLEGLEIVKPGEWVKSEKSNGYYIEMTVKVIADFPKDGKLILTRACDNEGGFGMLKFKHN